MIRSVIGEFTAKYNGIPLGAWSEESDARCILLAARSLLDGVEVRVPQAFFRTAERFIAAYHNPVKPAERPPEPVPPPVRKPSSKQPRILEMLQKRSLRAVRVCMGMDNGDILEHLAIPRGELFDVLGGLLVPEETIHELHRDESWMS